ncbi:glutaredoxin 2 [Pelobates fuscus]|uniref:glutaredoxin 2 n=1 Tax=Pelobates fuscus TaxID=191477 RepID=UPI002FE46EBC
MRLLPMLYRTVCRKSSSWNLKGKPAHQQLNRFTWSFAARMGNFLSSSAPQSDIIKMVKETVSENCVVIFSKTSCPYCQMAKEAFNDLNINYKVVELDQEEHGNQIQTILHKMTGARTVPRVFINGSCIGGGTETRKLKEEGKLMELVQQCGISGAGS